MEQICNTLNHEIVEVNSLKWHKNILREWKKTIKNSDIKLYFIDELKKIHIDSTYQ